MNACSAGESMGVVNSQQNSRVFIVPWGRGRRVGKKKDGLLLARCPRCVMYLAGLWWKESCCPSLSPWVWPGVGLGAVDTNDWCIMSMCLEHDTAVWHHYKKTSVPMILFKHHHGTHDGKIVDSVIKSQLKQTKPELLTLVLLNLDIPCLCKQCRSWAVGFWRSQLIWICAVCH